MVIDLIILIHVPESQIEYVLVFSSSKYYAFKYIAIFPSTDKIKNIEIIRCLNLPIHLSSHIAFLRSKIGKYF